MLCPVCKEYNELKDLQLNSNELEAYMIEIRLIELSLKDCICDRTRNL